MNKQEVEDLWDETILQKLKDSVGRCLHTNRATPIKTLIVSGQNASIMARWLEESIASDNSLAFYLITDDQQRDDYPTLSSYINDADALKTALMQKNIVSLETVLVIHLIRNYAAAPDLWFQKWSSLVNINGIFLVIAEESVSEAWLLAAANIGLIPTQYGYHRSPKLPGPAECMFLHLRAQPYRIRHPNPMDLSTLIEIEKICWPEGTGMSTAILSNRINAHSHEQLVLVRNDMVVGVVYSQRIREIDRLSQSQGKNVDQLHDSNGRIVQLLALNVMPNEQAQGFGGTLLEFALQWLSLQDIDSVVGVTRWSQYSLHSDLSPEEYFQAKTEQDEPLDPVLQMHKKHGAEIVKLIENYRPNDVVNRCYGVLVQYDLNERLSQSSIGRSDKKSQVKSIEESIEAAIYPYISAEFRPLFTRDRPLMDLGFDSLILMQLRDKLSNIFNEDLPATFFFQYGNMQSILDYFIECKVRQYYGWLYDVEFRSLPIPRVKALHPDDTWLIFVDATNKLGGVLVDVLRKKGQRCITVRMGAFFEVLSDSEYQVSLEKNDFIRLFESVSDQMIVGMCYLWGIDDEIRDEPDLYYLNRYHHQTCQGLISLVQGIYSTLIQKTPRLWVITWASKMRGNAQALLSMPVEALCNAIIMEHPELKCCRISLDSNEDIEKSVQQCLQEFTADDNQDQVFRLENKRYSPRLIHLKLLQDPEVPRLTPEGSYLIVGGCGGLGNIGLYVAKWHIEHGARHLILVDPQEISRDSQSMIDEFRTSGVHVEIHVGDVRKFEFLKSVFDHAKEKSPPIKGILHTLGDVDDDKILNMTWQRFENIFQYKVPVAWNLHILSKVLELEHFILFSAVGSILGPKWRSNRTCANAFLDALAHHRRNLKLPALAIDWGPWVSTVKATSPMYEANSPRGMKKIDTQHEMAILDLLYDLPTPEVVVADIDWSKALNQYAMARPLLYEMQSELGLRRSEILIQIEGQSKDKKKTTMVDYLKQHIRRVLYKATHIQVDQTRTLLELGLDELRLHEFKQNIQYDLSDQLSIPNDFFKATITLENSAEELISIMNNAKKAEIQEPAKVIEFNPKLSEPIAVIGMGCRFPGANSPEEYWELLKNGMNAITEVPNSRWNIDAYFNPDKTAPGKMYTRFGGFIDKIDLFDAKFFGISPREAEDMDPQQRVSLEVAWEAIENAGIAAHTLKGSKTGVFMGICFNDYGQLIRQSGDIAAVDDYYSTGNQYSVLAGRISYILGLVGPALAIDTACSSSLVSIDNAVKHLRLGECDMAIAGGVNLILAPEATINFCKSGMLSSDGRCKTFDEKADGYVRSEGCGILILKRLSDAERDDDRILAVIRATAINQDGATTGLTVPNESAQQRLIRSALASANLKGDEIQYVEAHGTGTSVGDPIEVRAISATYGAQHTVDNPLYLGSVKTNIGHTEAAAGVAGVIKCILSLQYEEIPQHLHFNRLNPYINIDSKVIRITASSQKWPSTVNKTRYAAVSSFGFSGTNSHLILSEAPKLKTNDSGSPPYVFILSAKSAEALVQQEEQLKAFLLRHPETNLKDVAYTLQVGREHFKYRSALIINSRDELIEKKVSSGFELPNELKRALEQWLSGETIVWNLFYVGEARHKIALPTYPFQRERYWADSVMEGKQVILNLSHAEPITKIASTTIQEKLLRLPEQEREKNLRNYLDQKIRQLLKISDTQTLDSEQGFFEMGMDSIRAQELCNSLQLDIGNEIKLSPTIVFNYPSLEKLLGFYTEAIFSNLFGLKTHVSNDIEKTTESTSTALEQAITKMSDQELEAMFDRELKNEQ